MQGGDAVEIDVEGIAATYPIAAARRQQRRARMASANLIERESLITMWTEAWEEGLWAAAWSAAIEGLTPQQAAWKPQPGRHSTWQIVNHLLFWREYSFRVLVGDRPVQVEVDRRNWEEPTEVNPAVWEETRRRFAESQEEILRTLRGEETRLNRFLYHLPHDNYHIGQIMYLRAMQGLEPIE